MFQEFIIFFLLKSTCYFNGLSGFHRNVHKEETLQVFRRGGGGNENSDRDRLFESQT